MADNKKSTNGAPPIIIKRQHRKSLVMRISAAGEIVVGIPKWIRSNDPLVKKFIQAGLKKLEHHIPPEKSVPLHTAPYIRIMVYQWAELIGLDVGRVQFRDMTRKWGSCSSNGNITLNKALFYLPEHLVKYVVVHELVHMIVFDHSPAFWKKLEEYVPNCKMLEQELNHYRV
jgi:predicted metal-dependent hydrolase